MCDYIGCASGEEGFITVIRTDNGKEMNLCPHCALCFTSTRMAMLKTKKGGEQE